MYGIWNRLQYMLSPQFDIYEQVAEVVYGKIADIGSGTGFGTHLLARHAERVDGYEVDKTARGFAQRAFSNGNIDFHEGSITGNIVGHFIEGYDFVTMIDVIEHIREDHLAVKNCQRLLKDGGVFFCSTPNRLSRYRKSELHVREYSPDNLKALLSKVFGDVNIVDFKLEPIESKYSNPIIAICS